MRDPTRVLITGGAGRLARALAPLLQAQGAQVWAPARSELELRDAAAEAKIRAFSPTWVLHPAALTAVDTCQREPARAWADNVEATRRLLVATRGVPGVFVSTDYVFGAYEGTPYDEASPTAPLNVYGQTKEAAEALCLGAGWAVARTAWLWGDGRGFPAWVLEQGRRLGQVEVVAQRGTPTDLHELARVLVALGPGATGIYHLVGAEGVDRASWARAILRVGGLGGVEVREVPLAAASGLAPRPADSTLVVRRVGAPRLEGWRETLARLGAQGNEPS